MAALLVTTVTDVTWNLLVSLSGDASPDRRWTNVGWLWRVRPGRARGEPARR